MLDSQARLSVCSSLEGFKPHFCRGGPHALELQPWAAEKRLLLNTATFTNRTFGRSCCPKVRFWEIQGLRVCHGLLGPERIDLWKGGRRPLGARQRRQTIEHREGRLSARICRACSVNIEAYTLASRAVRVKVLPEQLLIHCHRDTTCPNQFRLVKGVSFFWKYEQRPGHLD